MCLDTDAAVVHQRVVTPAQEHEIVERRAATARPVLDVMRVAAPRAAAGKDAVAVSARERPAKTGRNRPGLTPHLQRGAVGVFTNDDHGGVA
jgi:hypothetical protein